MADTRWNGLAAVLGADKNNYENGGIMNHAQILLPMLFFIASVGNPVFAGDPVPPPSPTVTQEFKVAPLRMTYDDLNTLLVGIRQLVEKANIGAIRDDTRVSLSVSADENTVSINGWVSLVETHGLPSIARSVFFDYSVSGRWNHPVNEVRLFLQDSSRTVTVVGSDTAQVEAIAEFIRTHFNKHTTILGGSMFRIIGYFPLSLAAYFVFTLLGSGVIVYLFPTLRHSDAPRAVSFVAALVAIPIVMLSLQWDEWLPGTAIYTGSASFVDRNANWFTVWGTFVALLVPPALALLKKLATIRQSVG